LLAFEPLVLLLLLDPFEPLEPFEPFDPFEPFEPLLELDPFESLPSKNLKPVLPRRIAYSFFLGANLMVPEISLSFLSIFSTL